MSNQLAPSPPAELIKEKYLNRYCEQVLGSSLMLSDSHTLAYGDENPPLKTLNGKFYFEIDYNDPVKTPARIGHDPEPIPGMFHWSVQEVREMPFTDGESDFDLVEIDRAESLIEAINLAAHHALDEKLANIFDNNEFDMKSELEEL